RCGRPAMCDTPPQKDLETCFIRGGSAGAALYTFKQPGIYAYVNHNLIEAVERRQRPLQGRRRMEQRSDEAGEASGTDPSRQVQRAGGPDSKMTTSRPAASVAGRTPW